ncbi:flagellar basal body L-ring protein FlgH [Flocculibacter collagenilyticus]|uniref:flagellar basal body L-ring protein FlgH n=1 Tax=Flocculibacter collagenilyticus TaxID=2744479 RepID=UPI0018F7BC6D|nr:flagellar basal body L-ring protein FlgH [Flocculibacter collagenilyticus]
MKLYITLIVGLLTTGCVSTQTTVERDDPYFMPVAPEAPVDKIVANGSLFNPDTNNGLYSDRKAHRVGDIITVVLEESTQASKTAKTENKKTTSASLDPIVGFGGQNVAFKGDAIQLGLDSDNSFKGDAKSNQSNSLSGNISVNILQVLPNGNLVIRGEKWLTLNTGEEFIRVTGLIRPQDITADNTIESTRVANARIEYSGKGDIANAQTPGWLARFFTSTWWPF